MIDPRRAVPVCLLVALSLSGLPAGASEPTYEALRAARPGGHRIKVVDFKLERDAFRFTFATGEFHMIAPGDGRPFAAVFVGQGSFELTPASDIERRHLGLLTRDSDAKTMSDTFESLVLLFTDDTAAEIGAHGEAAEGAQDGRASKIFEGFLEDERKRYKTNLHLAVLQDRLWSPEGKGSLFLASVDGKRWPPALAVVDRSGLRRLRLTGDIDPAGAESGLFVGDGDSTGFWYLSHLADEVRSGDAAACRPLHVADALHYTIDTRISNKADVAGTTTLRFKTLSPGLRVLPIAIDPRLRISAAVRLADADADAEGDAAHPLAFVQEPEKQDADAAVVFPEPLARGGEVTIRLTYGGTGILTDAGDGNYEVGNRLSWYPNLGYGDWATFDLTYHVPEKNQVVSVGEQVKVALEGDQSVSTWSVKVPACVAGFNYGTFKVLEQKDESSGVRIAVYTNPGTPDVITEINAALAASGGPASPSEAVDQAASNTGYVPGSLAGQTSLGHLDTADMAQSAMADGINAVRDFTVRFGPQAQNRIAITQQSQWSFGQSWPALIYLPYIAFLDGPTRQTLGLADSGSFVDQVGLHEMAHQWWGHLVGWEGYQDQWISEGLAEFSAALALNDIYGWAIADKAWENRRKFILEKSRGSSVRNCDAGPISLGLRLATRRAPMAHFAMTYDKGAYVFHMLRMMMRDGKSPQPDARFFAMMQDFAKTYAGKNATTADFKSVVERHMTHDLDAKRNGKMDWFFDQWVDGVEIPTYSNSFEIEQAGEGRWRIHGTVKQEKVSEGFLAMVPMYLDLGKGGYALFGRAPFKGVMSHDVDVTLPLPEKPRRVVLNAHHDVLAAN